MPCRGGENIRVCIHIQDNVHDKYARDVSEKKAYQNRMKNNKSACLECRIVISSFRNIQQRSHRLQKIL